MRKLRCTSSIVPSADRLVPELEKVVAVAGFPPKVLRMDNGPERSDLSDIRRAHPWNNGYIESLKQPATQGMPHRNHGNTLFEARVVIGDFKDEHNHRHRHSALGYPTPAEFAARCSHTHDPVVACEIN